MVRNATSNDHEKIVVLIGSLTQEGITAKIKSLGFSYIQKNLFSSSDNWLATINLIKELRDKEQLIAVFMQVTETLILRICDDVIFQGLMQEVISEVSMSPNLVFIYKENLNGDFSSHSEALHSYEERLQEIKSIISASPQEHLKEEETRISQFIDRTKQEQNEKNKLAKDLIASIYAGGVEVAPYKKRIDLTVRVNQFLEELDSGTFLRLYVPNGRYQADQLESFLRLFEGYFQTVEKQPFSIDSRKTEHGLVYDFKSKTKINDLADVEGAITRFEDFMKLSQDCPHEAEIVLVQLGTNPIVANRIVAKYSKRFQRLQLDIRHEYEAKSLTLRQQLESEVLECFDGVEHPAELSSPFAYSLFSVANNSGPITINITNPNIQSAFGTVINGDIRYGVEDRQLFELFEQYSEKIEAITLKSELEQLKDKSSPVEVRQTAVQKIQGFLYKIGPKIGDVALKIGIDYVEKQLKGL